MKRWKIHPQNEKGAALVLCLILIGIMAVLGMTAADISRVSLNKAKRTVSTEMAFQQAEGGIARAVELLNAYLIDPQNPTEAAVFQSTEENPKPIKVTEGDITYVIEIRDDIGALGEQNERKIIRCTATRHIDGGKYCQCVEVVVKNTQELKSVYNNAIFAGNSSEDLSYKLALGGTGSSTDVITGSMYAHGDIEFQGSAWANFIDDSLPANQNADPNRRARATDSVVDATGAQTQDTHAKSGTAKQDIITRSDIDAILNAHPEYVVNVKNEFNANGKSSYNAASSFSSSTYRANHYDKHRDWVIDNVNNPAHIFTRGKKKNTGYTGTHDPTISSMSSSSGYATTATQRDSNIPPFGQNTYHLEDPFVTASNGDYTTAYGSPISMTNGSNRKIFLIEGDLWVHNSQVMDFAIQHAGEEGIQIAFVVLGDIYFSDNVLFQDSAKDLFLFMALKKDGDSAGSQSGNIHIGDEQFGTVEHLDTMLYAENNFYDANLTATGSAEFVINGNMTAGNQVLIDRDSGAAHSKMTINYESRLTSTEQEAQNFRDGLPSWMKNIMFKGASAESRNFKIINFRMGNGLAVPTTNQQGADITENFNYVLEAIEEHNMTLQGE